VGHTLAIANRKGDQLQLRTNGGLPNTVRQISGPSKLLPDDRVMLRLLILPAPMIVDTNGDTINLGTLVFIQFCEPRLNVRTCRPSKLVSSVPRHLPVELYGLIVQHITSVSVLCNLCTVSRAFLNEAERILYHTIHLPSDFYCIYSWCKVIIGNPRLAILVCSLTLPWACDIPSWAGLIKFRVIVMQALSSLFRLSELDTYCSSPSRRYLTLETLHGHPFQLRVFENGLPNPRVSLDGWIKFFSQQPGIRHWTPNLPYQDIGQLLEAGLLPLLTSACIYLPVPGVLASRHIRALQINAKQCETLLNLLPAGLKMFERTLTRLSLRPSPTSQTKPLGFALEVLNIVSAVVPNLEFLGLESYINVRLDPIPRACSHPTPAFPPLLGRRKSLISLSSRMPPTSRHAIPGAALLDRTDSRCLAGRL
jgi:hypothetical protein